MRTLCCAHPLTCRPFDDPLTPPQVTQFPHAVLEVKLQLASGTTEPEWVTELLRSGYLREMPKFSKFVHGTAMLNRARVRELPYWWSPEIMPSWAATMKELDQPVPMRLLPRHGEEGANGERRSHQI